MDIGIIGGGAAGFMAAITAKSSNPQSNVIILEKTDKVLAKVKISGGGRCNVTNGIQSPSEFAKNYPRGEKFLKKGFEQFNAKDTIRWFESKGVTLKTEVDGRIFPKSNTSQSIIDCLIHQCQKLNIRILKNCSVIGIEKHETNFSCKTKQQEFLFDHVIITTGGSPKLAGFKWLADLGIDIIPPVPSLFTFNIPGNPLTQLPGLSSPTSIVKIQGTKFRSEGPILITHWGLSGPSILKLSAWAARELASLSYQFNISVNWTSMNEHEIRSSFPSASNKKISNQSPYDVPQRLWDYLLQKSGIHPDKTWNDAGKKDFNKLCELLMNDIYPVNGKTTFKEEFVTCGGVDLQGINNKTMESKAIPGLYFAGEVLDIDGITGGFNFQSAWTTGFIAGKSAAIKKAIT